MKAGQLIGLYGGTFDPVHSGHVHVANSVLTAVPQMAEVRFLPCYQPVHRGQPHASAEHRVRMLERALATAPRLTVDRHEVARGGPSYMVDTLRALKGEAPEDIIALMVGIDAFAKLPSWHEWSALLTYCHMIVVNRPDAPELDSIMADYLAEHECTTHTELTDTVTGKILPVTIPPSPISATRLREALVAGENVAEQLPDGVWDYIQQQGLYRSY